MRWHEPLLGMIDDWAVAQDDKPSRTQAIRRLAERGLAAEAADGKPRQKRRPNEGDELPDLLANRVHAGVSQTPSECADGRRAERDVLRKHGLAHG
jgi:hypothetical protein